MSETNGRSADDWFHDYCEANQRARQADARAENAEAMVDWLANQAADICADAYPKSEVLRWWEDSNWKEAARRAVAAGEG